MNTEREVTLDLLIVRAEELHRDLCAFRDSERRITAAQIGTDASISRRQAIELMKSINYRIPQSALAGADIWHVPDGGKRQVTTPRAVRHWLQTHSWNGSEWVESGSRE